MSCAYRLTMVKIPPPPPPLSLASQDYKTCSMFVDCYVLFVSNLPVVSSVCLLVLHQLMFCSLQLLWNFVHVFWTSLMKCYSRLSLCWMILVSVSRWSLMKSFLKTRWPWGNLVFSSSELYRLLFVRHCHSSSSLVR